MQAEKFTAPKLELDGEGFTPSFDLQNIDKDDLAKFYHKYGFAVFRNVIPDGEVDLTIDQIWNQTSEYWKDMTEKQILRDNPETWNHIQGFPKNFGFINNDILRNQQFWKNRKNKKVYNSFKITYEAQTGKPLAQPLLACIDRGSMMRPTKLNPQWKTRNFYHFDIDPWSWTGVKESFHKKYRYNFEDSYLLMGEGNYQKNIGYTKLAGVLALSDTNETSGGFQCAFGFQNYIKTWCQINPRNTHIQEDENLVANFQKIFMRKGSLLVFSRELPHNIYPNESENFRYAQYLRMTPESSLLLSEKEKEARKNLMKALLPEKIDVSDPISREIFMLD